MQGLRSFLALLLCSLAINVPGYALAASVAGVEVPPPLPAQPVTDTYWGVEVVDPYRFLENAKDPAVQSWLRAQANATEAILGKIPGRAVLLARIKEIEAAAAGITDRVTRTEGNQFFFLRRNPGEDQFKLIWRDGIDGKDVVLVDPEALAKAAGRPHAVMDFAPSRDGRKLAYSIQAGGSEIGSLYVIEVASGRQLIEPIDRIRFASVDWLDDGSGFFYFRLREGYDKLPPTERFQDYARRYRALDTVGTDRVVFSVSRNPELKLPSHAAGNVQQIPGTRLAAAIVYLGVDRNRMLFLADLDAVLRGDAQWRKLVDVDDRISEFALTDSWIYMRSAKNAPRYQILRMPLAAPEIAKSQIVVPESRSVISTLAAARDGLYFTQRDGATLSLMRISQTAAGLKREPIALPFAGNVGVESAAAWLDGVVIELGGWTRAARPYLYDPGKGGLQMLSLVKPGAYDAPEGLAVREVQFKSHDGTEVPLTILSRNSIPLNGRNPTILYGYGAYGITEDPAFNPRILAWLERGGVYAIAHVRGGGAYGEGWHSAGHKTTKHNTWKDAIAAGEWLVANKYSSPSRLGIFGGSAGGILVGRAITERPDLFAAAVPSVPVLDTVRSETRANGVANVPEYGTVKKEDEFKALLAMSSYHHLKDGTRYPAVMLSHGVNDTRVDIWQSAKFASRLGALTGSPRPVLMRLDFESGHGQGSTRGQAQERTTDIYTFFLWQFGDPQFQPR